MAEPQGQVSTPLFGNILAQPAALQAVYDYQFGAGLRALKASGELVRQSKRAVLTGMGASLFACEPATYLPFFLSARARAIESAELLYFLHSTIDAETAVVLVSRSGESIEVIKLLDVLKKHGCPTVGVLNVAESLLATQSDEYVLLGSPPDQLVAIQTYIATVAAITLIGAAAANDLDRAQSELKGTIDMLESWIPQCVAASLNWESFTEPETPLYILGRGSSLGSVNEGVLLMHETAKSPAIGMSVAQFRHGPVEVADKRLRAVIFGTQDLTAEIDGQLATDLTKMGGDIRWIGPGSPVEPLCPWPEELPEYFRAIFEIIPLQLLAYRTAEARGVTPGDFRWAPTVTSSEAGFPALHNQ